MVSSPCSTAATLSAVGASAVSWRWTLSGWIPAAARPAGATGAGATGAGAGARATVPSSAGRLEAVEMAACCWEGVVHVGGGGGIEPSPDPLLSR